MVAAAFLLCKTNAYAETKQTVVEKTKEGGDLAIMFSFDAEVVDIEFISPSGKRMKAGDEGVGYASGDGWSTYRITDAEKGKWTLEYDPAGNTEIEYSIINDDYGLWIQNFTVESIEKERVSVKFQADCEDDIYLYNYEIYMVSTEEDYSERVASGSAFPNKETELSFYASNISSGNYIFRLDVYYEDGDAEIFDSVNSDAVNFTNSRTGKAPEGIVTKLDFDAGTVSVDWKRSKPGSYSNHKLTVLADGEVISSKELETGVSNDVTLIPVGSGEIEIRLAYYDYGLRSESFVKKIDLSKEYLKNLNGDVTGSSQLRIAYSVSGESELVVKVNGHEGNYKIKESGELSFDLEQGNNTVYAELKIDDSLSYVIDTDVYFDAIPPEIVLFDNPDGKSVTGDSFTILGKVKGAKTLRIDGADCEYKEDGSFTYEKKLEAGENVINIEVEDVNGNTAARAVTLYKKAVSVVSNTVTEKPWWQQYLPLMIAGVASIVVIILALIFFKKKPENNLVTLIVWNILLLAGAGVCLWQYIIRYNANNTEKFLEIAEKSASEAVKSIKEERLFFTGMLVLVGLIVLSTVLYIVTDRIKKAKKNKPSSGSTDGASEGTSDGQNWWYDKK